MAESIKHEQIGAFRLMPGLQAGNSFVHNGSTILELGAGHAFPYTSMNPKGVSETAEDDSIEGLAFKDLPVQTGLSASVDAMEGKLRYHGLDSLLYWMFGWEKPGNSPVSLGGGYYKHLFELDRNETEFAAYRSDEQTAGDYNALDRKNRFAVLARKMGPNDHRYPFLICSGFGFSSEANGLLSWNAKGIASREDRGSYNSAAWTFGAGVAGSSLAIPHHNLSLALGPSGSLVTLGVKSINISVDKPQFVDRDSQSGLVTSMPVLSGHYQVQAEIVLSKHSVDTYLAYRDSFQQCAMKAVWTYGSYEFGLYLPSLVISDTAPTGDDVARLPITFMAGKQPTSNPFTSEIGTNALLQNGPLFCITKNTNSTNEMRRE